MAWISEAQKHYEEYVDYYASLLEDYVDNHILELAPAYGQLQEAAVAYLEEVTKKYVRTRTSCLPDGGRKRYRKNTLRRLYRN